MVIAETSRLILRQLTLDDVDDLATIYADPVVMKFWPSTRTYAETKQSCDRILSCYEEYGFGLWATIHKADHKLIGRCGLIPQLVDGDKEVEVAYLLAKEYWGRGLATEAAVAVKNYGFEQLGFNRLISLIVPENIASQKVALKNGMKYEKDTTHADLAHRVYAIHQNKIEISIPGDVRIAKMGCF